MWGWKLGLALKKSSRIRFAGGGGGERTWRRTLKKPTTIIAHLFTNKRVIIRSKVFPPTTKPPNLKKNGERKIRFELHPPPLSLLSWYILGICTDGRVPVRSVFIGLAYGINKGYNLTTPHTAKPRISRRKGVLSKKTAFVHEIVKEVAG